MKMRTAGYIMVIAMLACMYACGGADDSIIPDQRESILKFLENNHLDYEITNNVYKHFGDRGPDTEEVAKTGDSLELYFELYTASYTRASNSTLTPHPLAALYSNKPFIIDSLSRAGLNTAYWPEGLLKAKLGATAMTEGLKRGLVDCRQGDSVLIFVTSDLAFGEKSMATVPANTAMLYIVNVDKVKKQ